MTVKSSGPAAAEERKVATMARSWLRAALPWLFCILSPTWGVARLAKPVDKQKRARAIRGLNCLYFSLAIAITALAVILTRDSVAAIRPDGLDWRALLPQWLLMSRFWEVCVAFLVDAQDKLRPKRASSTLHWSERVMLAMRSYAELILDFGIVYSLLPRCAWVENLTTTPPDRITDMIWYSANVITTSGGGGFLPESPWAKMLSAAEVLCGVILLVVSFTVYVSRALGGKPTSLR